MIDLQRIVAHGQGQVLRTPPSVDCRRLSDDLISADEDFFSTLTQEEMVGLVKERPISSL